MAQRPEDELPLGPLGEELARKTGGVTDPEKVLAKARSTDFIGKADKLAEELGSKVAAYKALAPETADVLVAIAQELTRLDEELPGWEKQEGTLSRMGHELEAEFERIAKENQFASKLFDERKEERDKQQFQDRIAARDAQREELFSRATNGFTIHMACDNEDGTYALLYHPQITGPDGKPVQRRNRDGSPMTNPDGSPKIATKRHVVLLECSGGKARAVDSTQRSVIEKMGDKEVRLNPEENFETPRGEPFFVLPIREALTRRYQAEEEKARRDAMTERREISFTEGQTKKGVAVAHWPPQRPYLSGKRRGFLSVVVSFTGKGNFTLEDTFSPEFEGFLTPAVGQKLSLELPDEPAADADEETREAFKRHKLLVNMINRRIEYEAIQSTREANRETEAEELDADEPEEVSEATKQLVEGLDQVESQREDNA